MKTKQKLAILISLFLAVLAKTASAEPVAADFPQPCTPDGWDLKNPATVQFLKAVDERINLLNELRQTPMQSETSWEFTLDRQGKVLSSKIINTQGDPELEALFSKHKADLHFPALPGIYKGESVCLLKVFNPEKRYLSSYSEISKQKYGYINTESNGPKGFVIAPQFVQARNFSEGLAAVALMETLPKPKLTWFFINENGQPVTEKFDTVQDFKDGLAIVSKDGKFGVIDKSGKWIVSPKYDTIFPVEEGLFRTRLGKKSGLVDKTGKVVLESIYDLIGPFSEGIALVRLDGKTGYVNQGGQVVFALRYLVSASPFSEGVAIIQDGDKNYFAINKAGNIAFGPQKMALESFKEGLAVFTETRERVLSRKEADALKLPENFIKKQWVYGMAPDDYQVVLSEKKQGYLNTSGQVVVPARFDLARSFSGNLAIVGMIELGEVRKSYKYGLIDRSGKFVVQPEYSHISAFSEGIASITEYDEGSPEKRHLQRKVGLVNQSGQIILGPTYAQIGSFSDGLATFTERISTTDGRRSMTRSGYLDANGKIAIPAQYRYAMPFKDGKAAVILLSSQSQSLVYIDKSGKILGPAQSRYEQFLAKSSRKLIPMNEIAYKSYENKTSRPVFDSASKRQLHDSILTGETTRLPKSMIPEEMKATAPLHYVSVMGPPKDTRDVVVRVTAQGPVTLFLSAYHATNWIIQADKGAKIAKVIANGYDEQTISGLPAHVPVFTYTAKQSPKAFVFIRVLTKADYLDVADKVFYLTGVKPATIQFDYNPAGFVVNGLNNLAFKDPTRKFDQSKVLLYCSSCILSPDSLRVTKGKALATRRYHSGKFYYEAQLTMPQDEDGAHHATNIGITSSQDYLQIFNYHLQERGYTYGALGPTVVNHSVLPLKTINRRDVRNGDVIGIAVDLDNNRFYFSLNGKWMYGSPASISEGMAIRPELDYQAILSTDEHSEDHIWTVNFGNKAFKYPMPAGYLPYGAKASATRQTHQPH